MSGKLISKVALLLGLMVALLWWKFEPYQSHYLIGLGTLGDTTTQTLWGAPKEGRGDEWSTYLPMLKQAALEGFPATSALDPYREKLNWFISIPKADFSLFFLPNQILYWMLPAGKALSFQAIYYYLLLIGSLVWYLKNLGIKGSVALAAAVSLAFSHYYQVWWTSNFPTLAACFLPFAILTSKIPIVPRSLLLFWSIGHLAFGEMYPPTYFAIAVALIPFTLAIRPDLIRVKYVLSAALAAGCALALYWVWNADFITAVSNTSYPGQRINLGGGSSLSALAALVFPTLPVAAEPYADAVYELSVAGTFMPLLLLAVLPAVRWDRDAVRVTAVSVVIAIVIAFYAIVGFPAAVAKYTGFFLMPGRRTHIGLSVLVLFYSAYLLSRNWERLKIGPMILIFGAYAAVSVYLGVNQNVSSEFLYLDWYAYAPVVLVATALIGSWFIRTSVGPGIMAGYVVLAGMAISHIFIYGSFNPIMRGSDIMTPVRSQLISDWKELYKKNNNQPLAVYGNFGHLLRGEGLPALEAIHLVNVDSAVYEKLFPYLSSTQVQKYFNRFLGIAFVNVGAVDPSGATLILPLKPHAVSFEHEINMSKQSNGNLLMAPPKMIVSDAGPGKFVVRWLGVLDQPMAIEKKLTLSLPCDVQASWLTRSPIAGLEGAENGVSLRALVGEMTVLAENSARAEECFSSLSVARTE